MYDVVFTTAFRRSARLLKKRGYDVSLMDDVVDLLRQGKKLDDRYQDHCLNGNFKGLRECHIKPDWLLIYKINHDVLVLTLIDTGTHSELLGL